MEESERLRLSAVGGDDVESTADLGDDEPESMQAILDSLGEVKDVRRGSVVDGVVVRVDPEELLVDIGLKSEGVVSTREVTAIAEDLGRKPVAGDSLLVYVVATESPEGHPILSYKRAASEQFWRKAQLQVQQGEVIEARVLEANRGGVVVDYGSRAFVPISQLSTVTRVGDSEEEQAQVEAQLQSLVGQILRLKVIEADRRRNRLILSERQANRELRSQRRDTLIQELEAGQVRRGRVSNVASFGVFVDLGGADGLVHISELSWARVKHPSEVVRPGQEVEVFVISVDRDSRKIALSLRRAAEDPWDRVDEEHPINSIVVGEVLKQAQFGVFVRLDEGIEGLVHSSEISPQDRRILQEGNRAAFRVISIERDRRRLRLVPIGEPGDGTA